MGAVRVVRVVGVVGAVRVVGVVGVVGVGGGGQLEQLYWDWSGPLEVARFAAAWQSVVDRESVL
ncbi:hypothetical protein, partial [Streptomyces sp. ME109]|uniref:hypothetical protein n=1 Tax=Streptomyces sp. me109 TaxID=1827853 RepID=UPI0021C5BAF8